MDSSDWIALAAVLIALAGYLLNRYAIGREQGDRREQLDLMRQQLETEAADRAAASRANVQAIRQSTSFIDDPPSAEHQMEFLNAGPAYAVKSRTECSPREATFSFRARCSWR